MLTFLKIVFTFALAAIDSHWTCELAHRDPGVPATFYLYCSMTLPNETEIVSIGKYAPDAPHPAP